MNAWKPLPGPQTLAFHSKADVLFYGGAAGGGKTDLLLGLAHTAHDVSIIFRREYPQLAGIETRAQEIFRGRGRYNGQKNLWLLDDGRRVEFGACQLLGDEQKFQGRPHSLKGFDEITHFLEAQFRFLCGWLRSTDPKQRCRVVAAGNPPTDPDGEWVVQFFCPWLDDTHPHPALPGELRWFTTLDGREVEVESGAQFWHTPKGGKRELITPMSRTFIPARVEDNPFLMHTNYKATLQALPEPLRSKMLAGDFQAGKEDNPYQVIPTEWVQLAQERWKTRSKPDIAMSALGVDVARGGRDQTILAARYGNWFAELLTFPGSSTPDGPAVATLALQHRTHQARVQVDVIGVGGSVVDHLVPVIGQACVPLNGAAGSEATDKSGQLGMKNLRAAMYWALREALDPVTGEDLALPPDRAMLIDLCTPRWKLTAQGIQIEAKEDIIKRIGHSPDKGDAVVYAHWIDNGDGWLQLIHEDNEASRRAREEVEKEKQPKTGMEALYD